MVLAMMRANSLSNLARWSGLSRDSGFSGCGLGRKFRESCTGCLRADRLLMVGARDRRVPQQTVDYGAQLHQVCDRPQPGCRGRQSGCRFRRRGLSPIAEIGPVGGNQDWIGVRRCEKEMQPTVSFLPTENSELLAFKRVERSNDDDLFRCRLVVGSLSTTTMNMAFSQLSSSTATDVSSPRFFVPPNAPKARKSAPSCVA